MPPNDQPATAEKVPVADLRLQRGLTQREVAEHLGTDVTLVSRWETGKVKPGRHHLNGLAKLYGVPPALILFPKRRDTALEELLMADAPTPTIDARVTRSQQEWVTTRQALNANRPALAAIAADAYPDDYRLGGTTLLTTAAWLPARPLPLDAIRLTYEDDPATPIDGTGAATSHLRPLADLVRPYPRYTAAVRDVTPPRLFENRYTWRPLSVEFNGDQGAVRYGPTTYFATMDVHEAVAHETALAAADDDNQISRRPAMRDLPFRRHIGDPFDLTRRPALSSISTLTVRGGANPEFVLHRRDSKSVAIAGGMLHVIPSGIFQPSSVLPAARDADFDWWRNCMREFSEELLGDPEHNGDGDPVDYAAEPFATFNDALTSGRLQVTCVGLGLDALTLVCEILTVAVFEPDLFDAIAGDFVAVNDEGTVVAERVPFNEGTVDTLLRSGRMAPAAAGLLSLAWRHRANLL